MLIHVIEIAGTGGATPLASFRCKAGGGVARWCGDPGDRLGDYHVEWTIDDVLIWDAGVSPAREPVESIQCDGDDLLIQGRLTQSGPNRSEGHTAVLHLGDTLIDLEAAAPFPLSVEWVRVRVPRERALIYPYRL